MSVLEGLRHKDVEDLERFQLDRAVQLYVLAYRLQLSRRRDGEHVSFPSSSSSSSQSRSPCVLFVVAVVNNTSQAYRLQGNVSMADVCSDNLLSMLMTLLIWRRDDDQNESAEDHNHSTTSSNGSRRMAVDSDRYNSTTSSNIHHNHGGTRSMYDDILQCFLDNTMYLIVQGDSNITAPAA